MPDMWTAGKTLEDFQRNEDTRHPDEGVVILRVVVEPDVTHEMILGRHTGKHHPNKLNNDTGYLVWVREKAPA